MSLKYFKRNIRVLPFLLAFSVGSAYAGSGFFKESFVNNESSSWDFQGGTYLHGEGSDKYKVPSNTILPLPGYYVARVWSSDGPSGNWGWAGRNITLPNYSTKIYYACQTAMYKSGHANGADRIFYVEAIDTATWTYLAPLAGNNGNNGYLTTDRYNPRGKNIYARFISKAIPLYISYVYTARLGCNSIF